MQMKLWSLGFGGAEASVCSFFLHCLISKLYIYDANANRQSATEINMILLSIHATDAICTIFFGMMFSRTMESNDCSNINDTFDFSWKATQNIKEVPLISILKKISSFKTSKLLRCWLTYVRLWEEWLTVILPQRTVYFRDLHNAAEGTDCHKEIFYIIF